MSEISDMLRESADDMERNPGVDQHLGPEFLRGLASCIDAEMMELPRDRDGVPIHVGDTVYGEDGRAWHVRGVTIGEKSIAHPEHAIRATSDANEWRYLKPEWLTHERPDSWERIADELDEMVCTADAADDGCERLADLAERIRRLAGKED